MNKQNNCYKVLGLMSGTSLDGLDLCYAYFYRNNDCWEFEIKTSETVAYETSWLDQLTNAPQLDGENLTKLNHNYGRYLGTQAREFCKKNNISPELIASHGHTIFHQPDSGYTLQIGHGSEIAAISGITTCCDFRTIDVALGGQGAPLVPIGDKYLFSDYEACLNIGGFSNISLTNAQVLAFDICPANLVLNALANQIGLAFDKDGDQAKSGNLDQELFNALNHLSYYGKSTPKSLGREWVEEAIFPILKESTISVEDKLNTFCHHIAEQISISAKQQDISSAILVTGGGCKNTFLMNCLRNKGLQIEIPSEEIIDFKESLIFGFLGLLRALKIPNTLGSVTGARKNSISGSIYLP